MGLFRSVRQSFLKFSLSFLAARHGATAIEYSLIVAAIAVGVVSIVYAIGDSVQQNFTDVNDQLGP